MADQLTPIFNWPYPDPDDPLGGVAATVEALALAIEDVMRLTRRAQTISSVSSNGATTTTTEITIASNNTLVSAAGDQWLIELVTRVNSSTAGDWVTLRMHDDTGVSALTGPVLDEITVQVPSTLDARALPVFMRHRFTAPSAGTYTVRVGILRAAGSGNVKRVASSTALQLFTAERRLKT